MDEYPLMITSEHSMHLQGHGVLGAEGRHGIRTASDVLPTQDKTIPAKDERRNKGKDMFYSEWPELALLDDFETSLRTFDPTFEIGSKYFEDTLWSPILSAEAELVPESYFDNISFSVDRNGSATVKANPTTESNRQSRNGASTETPLNCDAHASSSSSLSDAELLLPLDDIALANQIDGCEGLEAILCSSQPVPTASRTMCSDETVALSTFSGPDFAAAHIPRPSKNPHDPLRGAPDMVLEDMAENPLDVYFRPLTAYEQPEMLQSSTSAAQKHRFPRDFADSCALSYAELQFCSSEMVSVALHGQPSSGSAMTLEAVPAKDLGFQKLQEGMNRLDLATKGRIRDALYRLANSVEQRHLVGGSSGVAASSGSKRFRSGGWAETQSNSDPMDQSVAQLLLQKSSNRKTVPPHRLTYS